MRILSIGGDPKEVAVRTEYLQRLGHTVHGACKRSAIARALAEHEVDAILIWSDLPDGYRSNLRAELRSKYPDIVVIDGCASLQELAVFLPALLCSGASEVEHRGVISQGS